MDKPQPAPLDHATGIDHFASGSPRFLDSAVAGAAIANGTVAAWREAFALYGTDAPKNVLGDFAVGIRAVDGTTYLAVDRFAVRSLCYRIHDQRVEFAERADELGEGALDPQALFDYLYFHVIPSPRTVYRGVYRLPPGHCAIFRNGELTVRPYWEPVFEESGRSDFAALKEEFLGLLHRAVETVAPPNVGCFLSGGTDSSTVAGMLRKVTGSKPRTYSIGFDAEGYDEMEYSRIAARRFDALHHEYYITPEDLVASIPAVAASYDQPFGNSSVLPAYYCARMAREDGIETILGGDGGDELFGGNTRYAKQRVFGIYDHVPALLRQAVLQPLLADNPVAAAIPGIRKASSYVRQARVRMPDRMEGYNLLLRLGLGDVLTPEFLEQVNPGAPVEHQRGVYDSCRTPSLVNRMLAYDWRYTLGEIDLPKVVGATRLAGVRTGFPMLDDHLVDFSMRLPASYKVKGLKLRWFFKEALRGFLPDEIITKKKQGFGLPFGPWTVKHAGLFALADDSLQGLVARGILRREFVTTLMRDRLREHPGYFGEMVWISMMLEQWLRVHAPDYRVA